MQTWVLAAEPKLILINMWHFSIHLIKSALSYRYVMLMVIQYLLVRIFKNLLLINLLIFTARDDKFKLINNRSCNEFLHYFTCASINGSYPDIPECPTDRVVFHVAVIAVKLQALVSYFVCKTCGSGIIRKYGKCSIYCIKDKKFVNKVPICVLLVHSLRSSYLYPVIFYRENPTEKNSLPILIQIFYFSEKCNISIGALTWL